MTLKWEDLNLTGLTEISTFTFLRRKYDRHIVLYSNEKVDREVGIFRTYMSRNYKDRQFEYRCMNINDVIDVQEIQQKIDQLLISLKEDEIEIFVSQTPAMQTAWYFCHARLGQKPN